LEPAPNHFDRRVTVKTPLLKPGAYLLTARMESGNESRVIVWLNDTAIVRKPMLKGLFYYVADARDGKPVAGARVDFFGYESTYVDDKRYKVDTQEFSDRTDELGQLFTSRPRQPEHH